MDQQPTQTRSVWLKVFWIAIQVLLVLAFVGVVIVMWLPAATYKGNGLTP